MPHHRNEEQYPTPYIAQVAKLMQSGTVIIRGHPAHSVEKALDNLKDTRTEYYESGGWGGPG